MEVSSLPETVVLGLAGYKNTGEHPGSFMQAILCNDLFEALSRADDEHRAKLGDIALYVLWNTTGEMRGKDNFHKWREHQGLRFKWNLEGSAAPT